jgi:hypothetical protein
LFSKLLVSQGTRPFLGMPLCVVLVFCAFARGISRWIGLRGRHRCNGARRFS